MEYNKYYNHIIEKDGGYHLASIGIEYGLDGDMPWAMMKTVLEFYGLPKDTELESVNKKINEDICKELVLRDLAEQESKDKDDIIYNLIHALRLISTSKDWNWTELENYGYPCEIARLAIKNAERKNTEV